MSTINKYHNGRIYKIVSHQTSDVYIGSTCRSLKERLRDHRKAYNAYLNGKFNYVTSFDILKNDDHDIILLEYCKCETKEELHARERFYIDSVACVNRVVPTRTKQQYYEDNKKEINDKRNQKYICQCGIGSTITNKAQHERSKRHITIINNMNNNTNVCVNIDP